MRPRLGRGLLIGLLAIAASTAWAGPYTFQSDPGNDATGPDSFEIYGIGYRFENDRLDVLIRTSFPQSGLSGQDSYGTHLQSPGDLYINVGGTHNLGGGTVYGLGLTTHSGDLTADPAENGLPWSPVSAGNLYQDALFSTGTYEDYPNDGLGGSPWDGGTDPAGKGNNYPVLIAGYGADLGFQGPVAWNAIGGQPWDYEIAASIDMAALGIYGQSFDLWWAMECGNDAVHITGTAPPIPEPATLLLTSLGCVGLLRRRRR